jgi:S-adenosylmethionine:tRNA ribosyltransferase-isomerase
VKVSDFDYELPEELVAQEPAPKRDDSRLLVLDRESGDLEHRAFRDLPELLRPGDLVVVNDTRVIPARLWGRKPSGGRVEVLLLEPGAGGGEWRGLVRASRSPAVGSSILLDDDAEVDVVARDGDQWILRLRDPHGRPEAVPDRVGVMPLPPYIRRSTRDPRDELDRRRYQTVYARHDGAVAAPTAGLHFTPEILGALDRREIARASVTLHVGIGTFMPVRTETVEEHRMHAERFRIPEATAAAVDRARAGGGRVVAVGTTVVRSLEANAEGDRVRPGKGECDLFIYPGFRFRVVDALITNFHLPKSTLLMLVSAFAGRERVLTAYREAVAERYRFYSYGDAMLLHKEADRRIADRDVENLGTGRG